VPATPPPTATAPTPTAPAPAPTAPSDHDLRFAYIHLASNFENTTLELRSFVDADEWKPVCRMPCDRAIEVEGTEARVTAPRMTPSNVFRIEPGRGRALVKVDGGAESSRSLGLTALIAGIPVSMVGGALFGYGAIDENDGLKIGGGITLGLGAAMILTALPLLVSGGTDVRDGRGRQIARELPRSSPAVSAF
jgi:hypothetical protein